jgi:hypothetical protein
MGVSVHDALREIQRQLADNACDEVPEGWLTIQQWAAERGWSDSHTNNVLVKAAREKIVERQQFRIVVGDSAARKIWHYKPKTK